MLKETEKIVEKDLFMLFAPDGSAQLMTLSPGFAECIAFLQLLAQNGVGRTPTELWAMGAEILPVKVTIVVTGTQDDAFVEAKRIAAELKKKKTGHE